MAALGFELLLRFLWGSTLILFFISRKETSERFLRIASMILVSVAALDALLLWKAVESAKIPTGDTILYAPNIVALNFGFLSLTALAVGGLLYARTFFRMTRILGFILFIFSPAYFLQEQPAAQSVNFLLSSLLIGAVFAGQYLGHWYLTVPGMHIQELKRVINILFFAVVLKSVEIFWGLYRLGAHLKSSVDVMGRPMGIVMDQSSSLLNLNFSLDGMGVSGDYWLGFGIFGVILLGARVLWGLLAPIILGYMVKRTVDIRSTQSATGILYALCVAVLFGEGTALYLKYQLGIYL